MLSRIGISISQRVHNTEMKQNHLACGKVLFVRLIQIEIIEMVKGWICKNTVVQTTLSERKIIVE